MKRLEKSLLEEATDLFDKDNNHDEADCNGDLVNIKDVLLSLAHQATCNCACSSTLEDIVNMKLNMEILRSRVDALQSLANANEVCPSVDLYLNEIDKLEQEILNEKRKTNRLEVELVSLKKQISEQGYKQNNVDCVVIEGNFTAEEIPKEPENGESYLLNDSCTIVQTKDANQTNNRNDNDNYFVVQLREYKGKQSDNFTRFHKQAQTINKILGKTESNFTAEETPKEPGKGESFLLSDDSCIVVQTKDANQTSNHNNSGNFTRSHKQSRINNKIHKTRKNKANHFARKPNSVPCNTYNENFAHGFDRVSSGQRLKMMNLNENKSREFTHSNNHPYQPANFRGQRAHIPKFSRRNAMPPSSDWREYLEFVRRETTQIGTRV